MARASTRDIRNCFHVSACQTVDAGRTGTRSGPAAVTICGDICEPEPCGGRGRITRTGIDTGEADRRGLSGHRRVEGRHSLGRADLGAERHRYDSRADRGPRSRCTGRESRCRRRTGTDRFTGRTDTGRDSMGAETGDRFLLRAGRRARGHRHPRTPTSSLREGNRAGRLTTVCPATVCCAAVCPAAVCCAVHDARHGGARGRRADS